MVVKCLVCGHDVFITCDDGACKCELCESEICEVE